VESRVVSDQHHRGDRVGHEANAREQFVGGGGVQLLLEHDRRAAERRLHQLERFAGAGGGRAKDELGRAAEPTKMFGDPLCVPAAPLRERPLTVRERWISPAGLGVPEEIERMHRLARPGPIVYAPPRASRLWRFDKSMSVREAISLRHFLWLRVVRADTGRGPQNLSPPPGEGTVRGLNKPSALVHGQRGLDRLIEELGEEAYVRALAEYRRPMRAAFSAHAYRCDSLRNLNAETSVGFANWFARPVGWLGLRGVLPSVEGGPCSGRSLICSRGICSR
jgi:hypothetical protein